MNETMEAYYSVFRKYNYNDENLTVKEQQLVNAAKNIIKDHELGVVTYESNVELLETQLKYLKEDVEILMKPVIDSNHLSNQNLTSIEKHYIGKDVRNKAVVEKLSSQLELAELNLELVKKELDQSRENTESLKTTIEKMVKEVGTIHMELEELRMENKHLKKKNAEMEEHDKEQKHGENKSNSELHSMKVENQLLRDQLISSKTAVSEQDEKAAELQSLLNWHKDVMMVLAGIILALVATWFFKMLF